MKLDIGGLVPILIIIFSVISAISKSKKKREQAERRRQAASYRPQSETQGEYSAPSATNPSATPMQTVRSYPQPDRPFGMLGELLGELEKTLQQPTQSQPQPKQAAQKTADDSEGQSGWSRDMRSGSLDPRGDEEGNSGWTRAAKSTDEGECDDIAHYHSRLEGRSSPFAIASGFAVSAQSQKPPVVGASGPSKLQGVISLQANDIRRAMIWSEVLKRPRIGVAPRMR